MFDSLKGIKPARDIRERAESTLEKLVKLGDKAREDYAGEVSDDWAKDHDKKDHDNIYLPLYESLCSTLPDYTEQDLQSLLLAKANNNYRNNEARVLGLYTGMLLHVLTERLEKEGKKAAFVFDLLGNQFDYLFCFAKRAGEVTVKKVKGKRTCSYLASYDGKAEKLVLEGNEGNLAAYLAGSDGGKVGTLMVKENEGDFAASGAGSHKGNVGTLIVNGNRGNWAASWAGSNGGNVGTLMVKENGGDFAAHLAGSFDGKIETLIVNDNEGDGAAVQAGSRNGKIETLALYKAGRNAGMNARARKLITGRRALALYKRLEKELPCLAA